MQPISTPRGVAAHVAKACLVIVLNAPALAATAAALAAAPAIAAAPAAASAAALPKGVTLGPSVEGITEYRLANGLKVLLFPDASRPTVTVNLTYLVGSRHENYGETGMAHLLEHLLFKGARNNRDITSQFSERGMAFNGTTGADRTNYYESFQASQENLDWALQMEADRMAIPSSQTPTCALK